MSTRHRNCAAPPHPFRAPIEQLPHSMHEVPSHSEICQWTLQTRITAERARTARPRSRCKYRCCARSDTHCAVTRCAADTGQVRCATCAVLELPRRMPCSMKETRGRQSRICPHHMRHKKVLLSFTWNFPAGHSLHELASSDS